MGKKYLNLDEKFQLIVMVIISILI